MIRIWKGIEREGLEKGVQTLFVEAPRLVAPFAQIISNIAEREGIQRIYCGAGKMDVEYIAPSFFLNLSPKIKKVVFETTERNLDVLLDFQQYISCTILRYEMPTGVTAQILPKFEFLDKVAIFAEATYNSISSVKDGLYADSDTLLWQR